MGFQGDANRRNGEPCRVPVAHHLLVNLKSFSYNSVGEDTDIFFSLYDLREGRAIRWEESRPRLLERTTDVLIGWFSD